MKIWHPYWKWEEYHAGMWKKLDGEREEELCRMAIGFTGDAVLYGTYMMQVVKQWKFSCEHHLTDNSLNRRAWIGHAAVCLAIGAPEHITRRAWWYLSDRQQLLANEQADRAISLWEKSWAESQSA